VARFKIPTMLPMRNGLLAISYMVVFAIMVFSYDSWADDELVVMGVVAAFLFAGLALWVLVAQKHRPPSDGER
jgi:ABC-type nickel/cobalt efflux system permease component RcnA